MDESVHAMNIEKMYIRLIRGITPKGTDIIEIIESRYFLEPLGCAKRLAEQYIQTAQLRYSDLSMVYAAAISLTFAAYGQTEESGILGDEDWLFLAKVENNSDNRYLFRKFQREMFSKIEKYDVCRGERDISKHLNIKRQRGGARRRERSPRGGNRKSPKRRSRRR